MNRELDRREEASGSSRSCARPPSRTPPSGTTTPRTTTSGSSGGSPPLRRLLDDLGVAPALPLRVLDVGCGTGVLRAQLEAITRWTVDGADLNLEALRAARAGRGTLHYYDVLEQREPFVDSYDLVTLCDVLEHVSDTGALLGATVRHLKPGGVLLVNVPALPACYSAFDEAVGHLRRYTRKTLSHECEALPVQVLETRYWGLRWFRCSCCGSSSFARAGKIARSCRRGSCRRATRSTPCFGA